MKFGPAPSIDQFLFVWPQAPAFASAHLATAPFGATRSRALARLVASQPFQAIGPAPRRLVPVSYRGPERRATSEPQGRKRSRRRSWPKATCKAARSDATFGSRERGFRTPDGVRTTKTPLSTFSYFAGMCILTLVYDQTSPNQQTPDRASGHVSRRL